MAISFKKRAALKAEELIENQGIKQAPVDLIKIANNFEILIHEIPLEDDLSGMALKEEDQFLIVINKKHHEKRKRFTLAHELGHIILHADQLEKGVHVDKANQVLRRDISSSAGIDKMEIEANSFAASLLMPESLLPLNEIGSYSLEEILGASLIDKLAKEFKVSNSAMHWRLFGLFS